MIGASAGWLDLGRGCSRFGNEVERKGEGEISKFKVPTLPHSLHLPRQCPGGESQWSPATWRDQKASGRSAPPLRSWCSWLLARPEASGGSGSGRDCRPAAQPKLRLLLPVSSSNNEQQTATGDFRQPRPLPRKLSPREGLSDGRVPPVIQVLRL